MLTFAGWHNASPFGLYVGEAQAQYTMITATRGKQPFTTNMVLSISITKAKIRCSASSIFVTGCTLNFVVLVDAINLLLHLSYSMTHFLPIIESRSASAFWKVTVQYLQTYARKKLLAKQTHVRKVKPALQENEL